MTDAADREADREHFCTCGPDGPVERHDIDCPHRLHHPDDITEEADVTDTPERDPTRTEDVEEEWRPAGNWPYEVSNLGRVRRSEPAPGTRAGKILSPRDQVGKEGPDGSAYQAVWLSDGDRSRNFQVHQLVAAAFIGPRPQGYEVDHKNGDRADNRASNLEYVPRIENRGAVLSADEIEEMKEEYRTTDKSHQDLADEYGVSKGSVGDIIIGKRRANG